MNGTTKNNNNNNNNNNNILIEKINDPSISFEETMIAFETARDLAYCLEDPVKRDQLYDILFKRIEELKTSLTDTETLNIIEEFYYDIFIDRYKDLINNQEMIDEYENQNSWDFSTF